MSDFFRIQTNANTKISFVADPDFRLGRNGAVQDLIGNCFGLDAQYIVVRKEQLDEAFCVLANGMLGEVAQKLVTNYIDVVLAGDFSAEQSHSQAFVDFVRETNRGTNLRFLRDLPENS